EQYRKKTFYINLRPDKNTFRVKQGELIAISGNTGSSGGPHVHFDIRDRSNKALNPLAFSFDEIVDNVPPVVEKVALVTLDADSRINDHFGRFEFYAYRTGNDYALRSPIMAHGNIGIEILATDKFRPTESFYGGVNYIDMSVDDRPQFRQCMDQIHFKETRRIHALMNYRTLQRTGTRFYKLYIDDGNTLPYYKGSPSDGKLRINEEEDMKVEVKLMDTFSNSSKLKLTLRPSPPVKEVKNLSPAGEYPSGEVLGNVLRLTSKPMPDPDQKASLYTVDSVIQMAPTCRNETNSVYLIDLR